MIARPAVLLAGALAVASCAAGAGAGAPGTGTCPPPRAGVRYAHEVDRALRSKRDLWGEQLLAAPAGPTYGGVRKHLEPLLYARAAKGSRLTASGVYYLPFAEPRGAGGSSSVALHVADGSQILWRRAGGRSLTVTAGGERYGSCLARLSPARLLDGYLPVLETGYVDASGARYRQESFAARAAPAGRLESFVRLDVSTHRAPTRVRVASSDGAALIRVIPRGSMHSLYVGWSGGKPFALDADTYAAARESVRTYWRRRLGEGASIQVPEPRVVAAERALLIQNLVLTWRYSVGNAYEEFSFPEGVDVAEVMAGYGFADVSAAILRTSLTRAPNPYPNWKMGQKLVGSALHYRLFRDRGYVDLVTPTLARYVDVLGRQVAAGPRRLLGRERYSSDIADSVYGLHSQAIAWQGVRAMGLVWAETGRADLATRCRMIAERLEGGLRAAVRASEVRLGDGSLFVPVRLLDRERAYDSLTASRPGSYWNLVAPYALASGFFAPGGSEARGALAYLERHGARLLGLVRAGAYALYGRDAPYPVSGTDQVYGVNAARFLAGNDRPDELVLALYGHLAAGMTPDTFVSGEAASVAPLAGEAYRSMYLPPNGAGNAAYLETLRLLLVHETSGRRGEPRGLELAFATPRAWLAPGKRIAVDRIPTSFGPLSFSLRAARGEVRASIDVPDRSPLRELRLRLRLPGKARIASVEPALTFAAGTGTIRLPTRPGRLELVVRTR